MRAKLNTRGLRVAKITAGALLVGVPSALAATAPVNSSSESGANAAYIHDAGARAVGASVDRDPRAARVRFSLHRHRADVLAGRAVRVPGRLELVAPRQAHGSARAASVQMQTREATRHARVLLQARIRGRWRVVAHGVTGHGGRFVLRYRVRRDGDTRLRVRFPGSHYARATVAGAGDVVGLSPTVASWYYDAGNTACGFHATYGVANKTLPCGTKVTIEYNGRSVRATVDDRGPYVYGRTFDLNQTTASKLGMYGVATVYASRQ